MAEALAQCGGGTRRRTALGINRGTIPRSSRKGDPKPPGRPTDLLQERPGRRRGPVWIPDVGP